MRKTNLFYSQDQDSNFLTFSNYTEALTGNILSTNCKMFPSKFICIYSPRLDVSGDHPILKNGEFSNDFDNSFTIGQVSNSADNSNNSDFLIEKKEFIKELASYYENKLAAIRDWCLKYNIDKPENVLNPLDYLMSTIKHFDSDFEITFVGDICEQEYNGTFMDNICIIENNASAQLYEYHEDLLTTDYVDVNAEGFLTDKYRSYQDYIQKLYGWAGAKRMPQDFNNVNARYDNVDNDQYIYYYKSNSYIQYKHNGSELAPIPEEIKFNILIPLFDIYQYSTINEIEYKYDDKITSGEIDEASGRKLVFTNNSEYKNQYDVPLGIWISDKKVVLERSTSTEGQHSTYRPSWSICISSQFKPFPYSNSYPNEIEEYSNPDKFASFAMIMSKQAYIINEFNKLNEQYNNVVNELNDLKIYIRTLVEGKNISDKYNNLSSTKKVANNKIQKTK